MTKCAAEGCDNEAAPPGRFGRKPIYCSPSCRQSPRRTAKQPRAEVGHEPTPDAGRPTGRVYFVSITNGAESVVVASDLGWISAEDLARRINEVTGHRAQEGGSE